MCGIIFIQGDLPDPTSRDAALSSLAHRGPDSSRSHEEPGLFIGHTRLRILDLTEAAAQPLSSPDGRYVLAYNGEIYNYIELRERLSNRAWPLRSSGDTEVLLARLALDGERCLPELRGMFAFVLWDRERRSILAARDPLGIKPLYYARDGDQVVFASELRAIAALGRAHDVDRAAVDEFLLTGSVRAPRTIYSGVRALLPGHMLRITDGVATEEAYWTPPVAPPTDNRSQEALVDELDERLRESVRIQLRSDVPVGSFLSGGIDSSLLTSYAAETSDVHTFSVGFESRDQARWDETDVARLVSDHIGTEHHHVLVTGGDFERAMDDLVTAIDQPSVDGPNSYFVSAAASPHVTVALSGQGGDELFAGYNVFQFMSRLTRVVDALPARPQPFNRLGWKLLNAPAPMQHNWYLRGLAGLVTGANPELMVASTRTMFTPREIGAAPPVPGPRWVDGGDRINEVSRLMISGYLRDTLLRDADAMSMQHSLEVRVPMVDHRLAEFALSIPGDRKVSWGDGKSLLRALARRRLPADLLGLPKRGFSFPMPEWLTAPGCLRRVSDALAPDLVATAGLVEPALVASELRTLQSMRSGGADWLRANRVWALYVLHEWYRRRGEAPPSATAPSPWREHQSPLRMTG